MTLSPRQSITIAATGLLLTISYLLTLTVSAMTFDPITELTSTDNHTKVEIIDM